MGGLVPLLFAADEMLAVARVPGGELGLKFVESEIFQHVAGELDAIGDFFLDLLGSTEDVGVVLGEAADAQQAVHHTRALIAIDRAEFAQADGKVAVGAEGILYIRMWPGQFIGLRRYSASS